MKHLLIICSSLVITSCAFSPFGNACYSCQFPEQRMSINTDLSSVEH